MDGIFPLVVPVNEDIKIVPGFGRYCDKLLVPAEIIYKGGVPLRREGFRFGFRFLIDNAAVVGRVGRFLRGLCKSGNGKAAHKEQGGAKGSQCPCDFILHVLRPPVPRHSLRLPLCHSPVWVPCPEYRRLSA